MLKDSDHWHWTASVKRHSKSFSLRSELIDQERMWLECGILSLRLVVSPLMLPLFGDWNGIWPVTIPEDRVLKATHEVTAEKTPSAHIVEN